VLHLIDEGALVLIAAAIEVGALDEGGSVDGFALETIAIGVLDQGRLSYQGRH
jgi:hypothetical protein